MIMAAVRALCVYKFTGSVFANKEMQNNAISFCYASSTKGGALRAPLLPTMFLLFPSFCSFFMEHLPKTDGQARLPLQHKGPLGIQGYATALRAVA